MYAFFINLINALIRGLGFVLTTVLALLPDSPFQKYIINNTLISKYVGYINYFVPVASILVVLEAWCLAVSVYYLVQIVLRWIKVIE